MTENEQPQFSVPQPGPEHAKLEPFVGTFKAEVKLWMGPGDPMVSYGVMTNSWQVNGLFLQQDYQGEEIEGPYPSFVGKGYWGYNSTAGHFEGFWIDIAADQFQLESGSVDSEGKVWTMTSTVVQPGTGATMTKKTLITLVDVDHHRMETFYVSKDGPEMKSMEINYKRK